MVTLLAQVLVGPLVSKSVRRQSLSVNTPRLMPCFLHSGIILLFDSVSKPQTGSDEESTYRVSIPAYKVMQVSICAILIGPVIFCTPLMTSCLSKEVHPVHDTRSFSDALYDVYGTMHHRTKGHT